MALEKSNSKMNLHTDPDLKQEIYNALARHYQESLQRIKEGERHPKRTALDYSLIMNQSIALAPSPSQGKRVFYDAVLKLYEEKKQESDSLQRVIFDETFSEAIGMSETRLNEIKKREEELTLAEKLFAEIKTGEYRGFSYFTSRNRTNMSYMWEEITDKKYDNIRDIKDIRKKIARETGLAKEEIFDNEEDLDRERERMKKKRMETYWPDFPKPGNLNPLYEPEEKNAQKVRKKKGGRRGFFRKFFDRFWRGF